MPASEAQKAALREKRIATLKASRQAAHAASERAIEEAMRRLQQQGKPINPTSVAAESKLSRQTVYDSQYAEQIRQLAGQTRGRRAPAKVMASPESLRRQLDDALQEIKKLKQANTKLEVRLENLLQASQ